MFFVKSLMLVDRNFTLENIKDKFHIAIATENHEPDDYSYESLIGNEVYKVLSYNLETVLAEKIVMLEI